MKTIKLKFAYFIYILYFWFLIPDFLESEFYIIHILSILFRVLGSVVAGFLFVKYRKHSRPLIVITVFIAYMLLTTLLNGFNIENLVRWAAIYVDIFGISVFTEYLIRDNVQRYLSIMNCLCISGFIINAITVFIFKDGLVKVANEAGVLFPYYFYDYDNSFIVRYIYTFAIVFFYDKYYKKNNFKWIVIVAAATLFYRQSIGSLLAIVVFMVFYYFRRIIRSNIINIKTIWVGYGLMTVFILFCSSSGILAYLIAFYHKTNSLGKRIYMWNKAVNVITHKFLLGTGVQNTTNMRNVFQYAQLHNSLLNTWLWGGFIGIALYCIFIYSLHKDSKKMKDKSERKIMSFLFVIVAVSSLMDGMELISGIYLFYFIVCNSHYFNHISKQREILSLSFKKQDT